MDINNQVSTKDTEKVVDSAKSEASDVDMLNQSSIEQTESKADVEMIDTTSTA